MTEESLSKRILEICYKLEHFYIVNLEIKQKWIDELESLICKREKLRENNDI